MMKKARIIFTLIIGLFCTICLAAQSSVKPMKIVTKDETFHELDIGDKVPDVLFKNVLNYKTPTLKLSDFKGKLIILDFWSSWCGSCISLFPYMDSLQKIFGSKIQIILVNTKSKLYKDDSTKICQIIEKVKRRSFQAINLPVIYNCEEIDNLFPCNSVPHEILIDGNGLVKAITSSDQVTTNKIQSLLDGREVIIRRKRDFIGFDASKPLFINGNGALDFPPIFRSMVIPYIEGVGGSTGIRYNGKLVVGYFSYNKRLLDLFIDAFRDLIKYPPNRIIIEASKPLIFQYSNNDSVDYTKLFCYELITPPTTFETAIKYMQEDLKRTFSVNVTSERRYVKCLVLKATSQSYKALAKTNTSEWVMDMGSYKNYIQNWYINDIMRELNNLFKIPFINETNMSRPIDLEMPKIHTQEEIIKAFKKAGFLVVEEERELDMIVISDKNDL